MNYKDPWGLKEEWIKDLTDAAGGTVSWDDKTQTATVTIFGEKHEFKDGENGVRIEAGRMYIDGDVFAKCFDKLDMSYVEYSGEGFSGFTLRLTYYRTRGMSASGVSVSAVVTKFDNTVEGERLANQMNDVQGTLKDMMLSTIETGLSILSGGAAAVVLGWIWAATPYVYPFLEFSNRFVAGETVITQTKFVFSGTNRPSCTNLMMIKNINGEVRKTVSSTTN